MSDKKTDGIPEPTENAEVSDAEKYAEEVPVGYWDSLMKDLSTWEKLPDDKATVGDVDILDTKL